MSYAAFKTKKCLGPTTGDEYDDSNPCVLDSNLVSSNTSAYDIAIPVDAGSGYNYSFEVVIRMEMTTVPNNKVVNLKIWLQGPVLMADGNPATGATILVGTSSSGITPTDSVSSVATTDMVANYYSKDNALSLGIDETDDQMDAIGEKSEWLVIQARIDDGTPVGDILTLPLMWDYDES